MSDIAVFGHSLADQNGHLLSVDQGFSEILGLTPAALAGKHILDVTHDADRAGNEIQLRRLLTEGTPFTIRKRYVRPDGSLVWVENHVSLFPDGMGPQRLVALTRLLGQAFKEADHPDQANPLVTALRRWGPLTLEEESALRSTFLRTRSYEVGEEISRPDQDRTAICVVVDGYAGQAQLFASGARQFASLLLYGDLEPFSVSDERGTGHSLFGLTKGHAAFASRTMLAQAAATFPNIMRSLWLNAAADAARLRVWTSQLGRRSAIERTAHLICEVFHRLETRNLTNGHEFSFPVNQDALGDMLGLSTVHVNRSLTALKKANYISWYRGRVHIDNLAGLTSLAEFDPSYLTVSLNA
ncbi:PAS domain S-box protein [Mesorhizobium sp. RP14(2022)]|uniref:PAS domain S-box protein n=1 Tax=Mesorhizobium liriopis TaxID=2953882 RepID=A0ABT1CB84_9HYPH|nr:helix-turn-helix domain-containing protein [Mesorhizobium liriopis]MCO6051728.1 PAS domain S-box protein [Mesorhizobium liriopis]